MRSFAFIAAFGMLGAQAMPTISARDDEPYIKLQMWSDLTGYVKACSAYISGVNGCTGWSEQSCIKRGVNNNLACTDCDGPKNASACGAAWVGLDFDDTMAPRVTFDNGVDEQLACFLKLDGTESYAEEASCNPYADPAGPPRKPLCVDPNFPSTLDWVYSGETCVGPNGY